MRIEPRKPLNKIFIKNATEQIQREGGDDRTQEKHMRVITMGATTMQGK